jgi:hypothetical protein
MPLCVIDCCWDRRRVVCVDIGSVATTLALRRCSAEDDVAGDIDPPFSSKAPPLQEVPDEDESPLPENSMESRLLLSCGPLLTLFSRRPYLAKRKAVIQRTKDIKSSAHRYLTHFGDFFCT